MTMRRKLLYNITALLLFTAWPFNGLNAQVGPADRHLKQGAPEAVSSAKSGGGRIKPAQQLRASGTSLWTEDFENGLNGWTVNTSTGDVDWQLTTTGNTGGYTPGPLESTTGFPGGKWIVADSDLGGTAGVDENTSITSPAITGLDTVAYMLLTFEQSFRQLNDDETTVEVSGNGGLNWTTYAVNTEVPGNQSTPGAPASQLITLNISNALNGGSNDIRIRFRWVSIEGYTYSWQVDDIELFEANENDLQLLSVTHAAWDLNETNFRGLPYTVYPQNEVRELKFRGRVTNTGSQTQHNVRLQVVIDGPGMNDATLTSAAVDLAPIATDSFTIMGYTPPSVIGDYIINYTVLQNEAEDEPDNNTIQNEFAVSEYDFARDGGAMDGGYDNQGAEYELGNWFHTVDWDNTLYGIDVALTNQTEVDAVIRGTVYDENRDFVAETEEYFVLPSDLNDQGEAKFITLRLTDPLPLDVDVDYLITMHHFGGTEEVWCATSGVSYEQTSLLFDYAANSWFYVTNTPMVRMNLSPAVSVAEVATVTGVSAMPSVFSDETTLRYMLSEGADVQLEVTDALGRKVLTIDRGTQGPGVHQTTIDLQGHAAGTYICHLVTGTEHVSLRLVKE